MNEINNKNEEREIKIDEIKNKIEEIIIYKTEIIILL
jgi:hypothetical protein